MTTQRRYYSTLNRDVSPRIATRSGGSGDAGAPQIVGYAAVYWNPKDKGTSFQLAADVVERIRPGAFDRAIREDDVRALFNHDADNILGRNVSGTLRLFSDSRGLRYEIDPPDTTLGRDLMKSLERGDVSGSSFAFEIVKEDYRREGGLYVRELVELRLFDVGPVTYPAYPSSESDVRQGRPLDPKARRDLDMVEAALALCDADMA